MSLDDFLGTNEQKAIRPKQRRSGVMKRVQKSMYRRAFSETQLLDLVQEFKWQDGESYHFITGGDVDGLSYLKVILRQQKLKYCLLSTWVMAAEDIYQCQEFLESGKIEKLDFYLGEVFPGSYPQEYALLQKITKEYGGTIKIFRNHSKIIAGEGDKFAFGVEGSANVNTNPRTENACITIGRDIYEFYREYYDNIQGFGDK